MWSLRSEDRLKVWKEFRKVIGSLPFDDAVQQTVHLWSFAPFVNHYLDHSMPADWPTPWELVSDNTYDDLAKAVGMLYTLYLSDHGRNHTFKILKVKASSGLETYNLVSIDDEKYILNFTFDEVISKEQVDTEMEILQTFTDVDLQLSKY